VAKKKSQSASVTRPPAPARKQPSSPLPPAARYEEDLEEEDLPSFLDKLKRKR